MKRVNWQDLTETEQGVLLERPRLTDSKTQTAKVAAILQDVKEKGDTAVLAYTNAFDQVELASLQVTEREFEQAQQAVSAKTLEALNFAIKQIHSSCHFHRAGGDGTPAVSDNGILCERELRPIDKVGLYIPGGSAPLISTVLMLAIPAQLAGCPQRVLCTPPNHKGQIDSNLLVAAKLCGITEIYKVGGAQAIAAMAYGTKTIPAVNKIFGPGNSWVTTAKRLVAQDSQIGVSIDMPAGPSELLVIADQEANPAFVAADLLSQAEHGPDSQVLLISDSPGLLQAVESELVKQTKTAPRKAIIGQSLAHARLILTVDIQTAIEIANRYAPEHLSLQVEKPEGYRQAIRNAGAVFLGSFTPETMGDYVNGSNHVLPTGGYARSVSGLSISDFSKYISFQSVSREALQKAGPYAEQLAEIEGLAAHKNAVTIRLKA